MFRLLPNVTAPTIFAFDDDVNGPARAMLVLTVTVLAVRTLAIVLNLTVTLSNVASMSVAFSFVKLA